jgi:putative ATPase
VAGDDLFAGAAAERLAERAPLAARLRPKTLDQIIGQQHLVGPGAPLRALVEADRLTSAILWGPPGTGKTTLASVVATETAKNFVPLSAVSAGVRDVREVVEGARQLLGEQGRGTILFLDEVHRFNRAQQDALLPSVEEGLIVLIGATTENPFFEVNAPLLSRSTLWRLEPLSLDELAEVVARGLDAEGATATPEAIEALTGLADGDARAALTTLEVAVALAGDGPVTVDEVERARHSRLHHYGESAHYDYISAFIKSIRGSDPDAGLYWLAQMLEAGEDARFLARRLVILASEDIGEADPLALVVADAAARAVEFVGLPEAQLNLAQAVVHLACAPKSNRVTVALGRAQADVRRGPRGDVPTHLRDAHYRSAASIGHGEGYVYPHDRPEGWADQEYRPPEVAGHRYYEPTDRGHEAALAQRLAGWRREGVPGQEGDPTPETGGAEADSGTPQASADPSRPSRPDQREE